LKLQPEILLQHLKKQLKNRLPGEVSHVRMLPPGRILSLPSDQINYHDSAVLILLFPLQQHIQICLIRRPATMKNHAGQIAFPGGKREKEDIDLVHTALREAQEEIGLDREQVEVLGVLSAVYVQVSKFLITPVLGWLNTKPEIRIDSAEVDEVIFIPLERLTDQDNRCDREIETSTGRISVPGFEINGHFVWGATAMMLAELVDVLKGDPQL
jgi:8-oxo-dGTP pyrophosphatase MutT (NUDIX family)